VLIVESTYGVQSLEGREEKELRFTNLVHSIIRRGGHVLLPTFALGRAQELLLILDEYWKKHPDLHSVPIYYASSLARKCMAVYQTYIHTMNSNIRSRFARRDNPFVFKYVSYPSVLSCVVQLYQAYLQRTSSSWLGAQNSRRAPLCRSC
jgi:cleavage and polyadenylation specificity factor subunit 3